MQSSSMRGVLVSLILCSFSAGLATASIAWKVSQHYLDKPAAPVAKVTEPNPNSGIDYTKIEIGGRQYLTYPLNDTYWGLTGPIDTCQSK